MKTNDLIAALAADRAKPPVTIDVRLAVSIAAGVCVAAVLLAWGLGVRRDLVPALGTWRFDTKMILLVLAAMTGIAVLRRVPSPTAHLSPFTLLPVAALLVSAVVIELLLAPSAEWATRLMGSNALVCLTAIPVLSAAPLALILWAMRQGAPSSPANAGTIAGFAAFTLGALLYGLHCFDDSPLFVATWYSLAAIPVIVAGRVAGGRVLRW